MTRQFLLIRHLRMTPVQAVGGVLIVLAAILSYGGLQQSFRPYTERIEEAVESGRSVQLFGFLGNTGAYDAQGRFTFVLEDKTGHRVTVVSREPKPTHFELATSIVVIGRYDNEQHVFLADQILVKCPSKYHEQDVSR
ncbi:MAG: cytochrome c maturation protein CcmE domain-containing protein [Roseiflexus sp.]